MNIFQKIKLLAHGGTPCRGMARKAVLHYACTEQIGGDSIGMKKSLQSCENALLDAARKGTLTKKLKDYVKSCRPPPDADPKKDGRLPTLAGFCGSLECGVNAAVDLQKEYPSLYEYLCAVLEDEALNATRCSPTIVNAYLKEHFGYGEKQTEEQDDTLRLIFEHDILEDGA